MNFKRLSFVRFIIWSMKFVHLKSNKVTYEFKIMKLSKHNFILWTHGVQIFDILLKYDNLQTLTDKQCSVLIDSPV